MASRSAPPTILVVEDESTLRHLLRSYIEREGMKVLSTGSGAGALNFARTASPDLIILDLGLPDVPGEEVAVEMRNSTDVPILILTAKSSEANRIRGLELGADDYITKPFSPHELVLRIKAILRRGRAGVEEQCSSFGHGEVTIDHSRREVVVRGGVVELTPTELGLLQALVTTPGRVYSRFELINRVRGHEFEGYERTIDSHIKNLRRKIERNPHEPEIVETVLGGGYRFGLSGDE